MAFRKTFVLGDESVNSKGFWLKNDGCDVSDFQKNAPCFYDHNIWDIPLGHWESLRLDGGQWKADLVIEGASDEEKEYIRKIENGDIKGASFGFDPLALSEDPADIKPGQTRPTITKWKPFEASITPLPANTNAMVALRSSARGIVLASSKDEEINTILPIINKTSKQVKMEKIAELLGRDKSSTEDQLVDALKPILAKAKESESLSVHIEEQAKTILDDEQHKFFVSLSKTSPSQALEYLKLNSKKEESPAGGEQGADKQRRVSELVKEAAAALNRNGANGKEEDKDSYEYLSKNDPAKLKQIKDTDPAKFKQLEADFLKSRSKK